MSFLACRWTVHSKWIGLCLLGIVAIVASPPTNSQTILTEGTNLSADVSAADGRIAFDLLGRIWILPKAGGLAQKLPNTVLPARYPRWSPSGRTLLYQVASPTSSQLWLHDMDSGQPRRLSDPAVSDWQASWHPDGERIVFSSATGGHSLDLWEFDIPTGLRWRISSQAGDETEPAWSANGKHLSYISHDANGWALILRRHGEPDERLVQSSRSLRAPSWRPDGSLITFLRETDSGYSLDMVILAKPPLVRQYSDAEEDFFLSRVSWPDRNHMIYTADGKLLSRNFDGRRARTIPFRASIEHAGARPTESLATRSLPVVTPPTHKLVMRAARLFDGVHDGYRVNMDVVLDGARISAVTARQSWPDMTILDLGDVTILPGFIDIHSTLPKGDYAGVSLLAYGVTTIVSNDPVGDLDANVWFGEENPGPRLIRSGNLAIQGSADSDNLYLATIPANTALEPGLRQKVQHWQQQGLPILAETWTMGLALGADLLLGADTLPRSPLGRQYQDMRFAGSSAALVLVSGMADATTPGLQQLLSSRQAQRFGHTGATVRYKATSPQLSSAHASIVVGSKPSGLPPGLALHAELRALSAAGLSGNQVLRAAGTNIGKTLGLEQQIGRVIPGAFADLVLVSGDPLANVADAVKIVAIVRNGRFFSLVGLLERETPVPDTPAKNKNVD